MYAIAYIREMYAIAYLSGAGALRRICAPLGLVDRGVDASLVGRQGESVQLRFLGLQLAFEIRKLIGRCGDLLADVANLLPELVFFGNVCGVHKNFAGMGFEPMTCWL